MIKNTFYSASFLPVVIPAKAGIQVCILMHHYYVYILATKQNGTLYIGVTNDLERRIYEHKSNLIDGFTRTYNIHRLVYYEETTDIPGALQREKQLKAWQRKWKIQLIEELNPEWRDLSSSWTLEPGSQLSLG